MLTLLQTDIKQIFDGAQIVSNLGIMVVISSLFIYIFYKFFERLEKQNEKMFTALIEKDKIKEQTHDKFFDFRVNATEKINSLLHTLLIRARAERAYIFEFHNSGVNMAGLPFAKFSMTYEVTDKGISHVIKDYQNMPLTCLGNLITDLQKAEPIILETIDSLQESNPIFFGFLSAHEVESYAYIGLKDSNSHVFAVLALNIPYNNINNESDKKYLKTFMYETSSAIESILDVIKHKC